MIFQAIKNFLFGKSNDTSVSPVEIVTGIPDEPRKKREKKADKHTKSSLSKLTKIQLEKLGKAEFGVDLDRRKTKIKLVEEILKLQKN